MPQPTTSSSAPPRPRIPLLVLAQAILALLSTYLISKISFIGRVGIATVHKEYRFLRSGWKTFILLFGLQALIIGMLSLLSKKYPRRLLNIVAASLLFIAVFGLYITYQDFLHTYTHRLLKERFHLGFYFFWLGWLGSCIFFLAAADKKPIAKTEPFPIDPNAPGT